MEHEQLLLPRFKVIAEYPKSPYAIGDIIYTHNSKYCSTVDSRLCVYVGNIRVFERCDKVFQPLQWWEERQIEDMPEYVQLLKDFDGLSKGCIRKVSGWDKTANGWSCDLFPVYIPAKKIGDLIIPFDYTAYTQSK